MTRTGSGPVVVVDLSNLCRDRRFLKAGTSADLGILDRFVTALEESSIEFQTVMSVADRSLPPLLDSAARRRLVELERDGLLEYSSLADDRLLELAFSTYANPDTLVASMDNFDDFRRTYPSIQGSTGRFIGWSPDDKGRLLVGLRDMGVHTHRRMSRKEESAEFKARRLQRHSIVRRAAATYYQCENSECLLAQLWPDRLPELPRYDDHTDQFVCPSCQALLAIGEPRPAATQLIVFLHGIEQFRLLLEEGGSVEIGRTDTAGCVGLASRLPAGTADAVSRAHTSFRLAAGRVVVEDLSSRNGTVVRPADGREESRLPAGSPHVMQRRDEIALPSGITIELSGRSIPNDDDGAVEPEQNEITDDRATRILVTRQ